MGNAEYGDRDDWTERGGRGRKPGGEDGREQSVTRVGAEREPKEEESLLAAKEGKVVKEEKRREFVVDEEINGG